MGVLVPPSPAEPGWPHLASEGLRCHNDFQGFFPANKPPAEVWEPVHAHGNSSLGQRALGKVTPDCVQHQSWVEASLTARGERTT